MKTLREQYLGKCKHFNGLRHNTCNAGVEYKTFHGGCCPCLRGGKFRGESIECCKREWPTEHEATEYEQVVTLIMERAKVCLRAVGEDAERRGLCKGHGGVAQIHCPVCKSGVIHYSVSAFNGHRQSACSTDGCFAVIE